MHPEWQQKIQPILSKLFPNVQFVATTHSPLVVGGIPIHQVFKFERNEDRKIELVELEADATMGRPNQILTSELFGLETTLDQKPETVNAVERYKELYIMDRSPDQEEEFQKVRKELDIRIPVPSNDKVEERAINLLEALLEEQIGQGYTEVKEKVVDRATSLFKTLSREQVKRK